MLFSDWDRSGRRDLRVSNDRHYYDCDGEEQLWRIAPGRAAAPLHRRRRLGADADLGHGHRQLRRDRRRLSRRLPDQPGPTTSSRRSTAGPVAADLPRHRPQARRHRRPAVRRRRRAALDRLAPRVPGRQQRRLHRPVRLQGQRRARSPTTPTKDPSDLFLGQPDGTFVEARRGRRHRRLRRAAAAPPSPTSTSTACSTSSRSTTARRSQVWRNVGAGDARGAGADGPLARRSGSTSPARTGTRSAPGSRSGSASTTQRRELTVGGGHVGGELGWIHFGLGPARDAQSAGAVAGRRRSVPWLPRGRRTSSSIVERGATRPGRGRRRPATARR